MNCKISVYLAYGMAIYCLACIYYVIMTRDVGTPFRDSLNEKQIKIKMESANVRRNIFCQGVIGGLILMVILRPFNKC
jgi:hypothetical protein